MSKKYQKILNISIQYRIIISIFIILLPLFSFSQIKNIGLPFITNYIPLNYGAGTQTWASIQDNRGIMYFANNTGILEFDGQTWKIIKTTNLSNARFLTKSEKGKIYVSAENEVGYLSTDLFGNTIFISILNKIPQEHRNFGNGWRIFTINNKIFLQSSNYVFVIEENDCKVFHTNNKFHLSYKIDEHFYVNILGKGIHEYKNDTLVFVKNSEYFADNKFYSMLPFDANKKILFLKNGKIFIWENDEFYEWKKNTDFLINSQVYYAEKLDNYFIIGTNKGVFIIDKQGQLIQHINKENGLISNNILHLFVDNMKNLWVSTNSNISYIEITSPYTIIDERFELPSNSNPYFLSIFNNILYTCIDSKLMTFPIKKYYNPLEKYSFTSIKNSEGQSWNIFKITQKLFFTHNPGIYEITGNKATKIFDLNNNNVWKVIPAPYNAENKFIAGTNNGIYLFEYENKELKNLGKIKGFDINTRNFLIDSLNYIWISEKTSGLYRLKLNAELDSVIETKLYTEKNGLPSKYNTSITLIKNQIIVSTSKQLYKYDYKLDSLINYEKFNSFFNNNVELSVFKVDSLNNIWIIENYEGTKNDILNLLIPLKNGEYKIDRNIAGKLSAYKVGVSHVINKNSLFFSTNKGIIHFDYNIKRDFSQPFNTLIRKIEFIPTDSLLFGGNFINEDSIFVNYQQKKTIPKIKFHNNSLRFIFASTFYEEIDNILFQYKLENFDKEPSNWTTENKKEYTNLPPGKYTFIVKSKNIYQIHGKKTFFTFIILPPWYRTTLAYISYVFLSLFFLIAIIKFSTHRLYIRNLKLEIKVQERTNELHMKNVELEQQKEEILTQTEELEIINSELEKLSLIASETDNAVILMDKNGDFAWVNDAFVKMFGYTLADLIGNISANIISEKTNEKVKKIIQKCFDEKISVEYELLTETKHGKQLWVHTTLTPMLDEFGEIKTLVAIDSDITNIKDAERKIKQQNKNIKGSIRYALTIQRSILPPQTEIDNFSENFIIYRPKDIVSGDFYWYSEIKPYKLSKDLIRFIAAVDCTGHGVPGAFMSLIGSRLLSEIINEKKIYDPANILINLDKGVKNVLKQTKDDRRDGMDISLCKIEKDNESKNKQIKVIHAGAKLPLTYYKQKNKKLEKTKTTRKTIGWKSNIKQDFFNTEIIFERNDIIYLYTDGLKDQNNKQRKKLGTTKINTILIKNINKSMEEQKQALENGLAQWQNKQEQRDDITFIGIKL